MDRYRVVSPEGEQQTLELEKGCSVAEAYVQVASLLAFPLENLTLLLRNAPSSALPTLRLPALGEAEAQEPLWRHAAPGSVLLVELHDAAPDRAGSAPSPAEPPTEVEGTVKRSRKEKSGPLGLRNLGNTCYLNSALQCLAALPLGLMDLKGPTCRALRDTFQMLDESEDAVAPAHLKACVATGNRIFAGSGQQDAQEFLQSLLEALHGELTSGADGPSLIRDIFEGQLRSELRCACGSTEAVEDPFWSLPVSVPSKEATLDQVLESFFSSEALEGWSCDACAAKAPAATGSTRRLRLQRMPKVLQLHLKRFQWNAPPAPIPQPAPRPSATPAVVETVQATSQDASKKRQEEAPALSPAEPPAEPVKSVAVTAAPAAVDKASGSLDTSLPPLEQVAQLPWEKQEKIYALLLRVLERLRDQPQEPKFRSLSGAPGGKLQQEVLAPPGGEALLKWCGFRAEGDRFEAAESVDFGARHAELMAHATSQRDRAFRVARDQRIEAEKLKALPTGDTGPPLRRWGGLLPGFGSGAQRLAAGMQCSKIMTRISLPLDPSQARGFQLLDLSPFASAERPDDVATYQLSGVVRHLGSTPFSGHYVAYCWHQGSNSWHCFDDARVRPVPPALVAEEALSDGAYVIFLEQMSSA